MQPHAVSRHCCAMGKWLQDWDPALRAELPALCKEGNIQGYSNLSCQMVWMPKHLMPKKVSRSPFAPHFPASSVLLFFLKKKYNLAPLLRMHKDRQGPPAGALHVPRVSPRGPRWLPSAATIAWWLWQLRTQKSLSTDQQAWHWHQPMGSHRKVICSSST